MSKKLLSYILVLIGTWFLWDYTRYRHTEMWWFKRFMAYPGIKPDGKGFTGPCSVRMAFDHLQRLKKYHPEKIREKLPFEKEVAIPVDPQMFTHIPKAFWFAEVNSNTRNLNAFQKQYIKRAKAVQQYELKTAEIRKKYEDGNVE